MKEDIEQIQGLTPTKSTIEDRMQQFDQKVAYNPGIDYNYDTDVMIKHQIRQRRN